MFCWHRATTTRRMKTIQWSMGSIISSTDSIISRTIFNTNRSIIKSLILSIITSLILQSINSLNIPNTLKKSHITRKSTINMQTMILSIMATIHSIMTQSHPQTTIIGVEESLREELEQSEERNEAQFGAEVNIIQR